MDLQKNILLVEDDEVLRKTLTDLFSAKYVVEQAADGEEAIEKVLLKKPHLVLLDLLLPKLDGFGVLARIRSLPDPKLSLTPVIVLSNLSSHEDILKAENWKVQGYLVKANTSLDQIVQKVEEVLGK